MVGNSELTSSSQDHISQEFQELKKPEGELHLRFCVASGQEFALSATGIREVIAAPPDRITPIPNAIPLLLGTLNLRGRVIWVADLGQFLGDPAALNTERAEIPIIAIEAQDIMLGLAVDQIIGMDWFDGKKVQTVTNVPASVAPFLRGEWLLDAQTNQWLRLLDQTAILQSVRWAA